MNSVQHDAPYYDFPPGCTCLQDLIEKLNIPWNYANIMKAAMRQGFKGGPSSEEYDCEKIKWFADRQLRNLRSKRTPGADTSGTEEVWLDMSEMPGARSK